VRGGYLTLGRWRGALLRALGKLPGLFARRRVTGRAGASRAGASPRRGFERERQTATLDRFSSEPDEAVKAAVDDALERLRNEKKPPGN
jgi:hypothetical protein